MVILSTINYVNIDVKRPYIILFLIVNIIINVFVGLKSIVRHH